MNEDKKHYLIIYHKEDNDGLFSMAIIYNYLKDELRVPIENIRLYAADYDMLTHAAKDPIEWRNETEPFTLLDQFIEDCDYIIMTDISFNNFDYMKKLYKSMKNHFIWIDHHAPVINESIKNKCYDIQGLRDKNRSAILNAYKYFYDVFDEKYLKKDFRVEFFRILSAYDSWSYEREGYDLDYVKNVNTGVTNTYCLNADKIIELVNYILYPFNTNDMKKLINENYQKGYDYNQVLDTKNESLIKTYGQEYKISDTGRSAVALFTQGATNSLMFKSVIDKYQNGIVFKHLNNDNWAISLYNTKSDDHSFHCGNYLKETYGGGGHEGAAGCTITQNEFIKILKSKTI